MCILPLIVSTTAVLSQWCEELGRLKLLRHQNNTAMEATVASQNAAMEVAKAAALCASMEYRSLLGSVSLQS